MAVLAFLVTAYVRVKQPGSDRDRFQELLLSAGLESFLQLPIPFELLEMEDRGKVIISFSSPFCY